MALSATFTANFSSFYDAVEKADKYVADFGARADKVGPRLAALGNSFSGVKIVQEATLMAKAIEDIGGVSKLTEKELARVGSTAQEAVAKMKALGMDVPKNLQEIADKTKGANTASTDWLGTINKIAGAVGIAFSVGAITNFIGSVFQAASAVKDLSDQWGVSTRAVQQWTAAAKLSGVESQTIGKTIQFLTEALAESSDEYVALLNNIRLDAGKLAAMPLEDAYREVLTAIGEIEDQTLQLDVAIGLLGPGMRKQIGAIRDGMVETAVAQKFMSDETIKRLTAAEAQWKHYKDVVVIWTAEMSGSFLKNLAAMTSSWTTFVTYAGKTMADSIFGTKTAAAYLAAQAAATDYSKQLDGLATSLKPVASHGATVNTTLETTAQVLARLKASTDAARQAQASQNQVTHDAVKAQDAINRKLDAVPAILREIAVATTAIPAFMPTVNAKAFGSGAWSLPVSIDLQPPKPGAFAQIADDLSGSLTKSILSAVQGGGSVLQAAGSTIGSYILDPKLSGIGKSIQTAASKLPGLIGGAISSAIPVVGAFIGPAISWLSNKISSWFGKKEHEKLRDSFITAAGGVKELTRAAELAGVELDKLFKAKNTDQVNSAIAAINAALAFQETALDAAMEAAKRYGFTIEELGPAMAAQELDKQAQQLFKDWEVLNAAGIDTVAITDRMADAVNAYLQDAITMGVEVPAAMRPMLEQFAESGRLLDENGDAITDLEGAGVDFAMTMSEGFEALIDSVHELTDAIARGLAPAIADVPDIDVATNVRPPNAQVGRGWLPDAANSFAQGTGGFRNFGKGTPVMLHGWEAVVPRDDASATVTGALGPTAAAVAPTIIINAQGAFFDTPGDLQRLADRVNDALTAKFGLRTAMRAG